MVLKQSGAKGWADSDVRAKMMAAWTGQAKGLIEYGGYSHALAMAMMDPEHFLSASWRGREVDWHLNVDGEYLVDGRDDSSAEFRAKDAENLCLSDGTAESLDDLTLLLGIREYRLDEGVGAKLVDDYITQWRRALDEAKSNLKDYEQNLGWAGGDDALKYLGKAKSNLERILKLMETYDAVEVRMRREHGLNKVGLQQQIEILKERIRNLRDQQKGNNRGGGRQGGGRGFGGGGGGGL
jgi:hypothetical protein